MAKRRRLVTIRRADGAYYDLNAWAHPWALRDRFAGTMRFFPDRAVKIVRNLRRLGHDVQIYPIRRKLPAMNERLSP